jgi:hypothetical protein
MSMSVIFAFRDLVLSFALSGQIASAMIIFLFPLLITKIVKTVLQFDVQNNERHEIGIGDVANEDQDRR